MKPRQVLKHRAKLAKKGIYPESNDFETKYTIKCIVIDMSAVSKIDSTGVNALREIVAEYSQIDIPVYLAGCSPLVYDKIQTCDQLQMGGLTFVIFATIHDAVFFAQRDLASKSS